MDAIKIFISSILLVFASYGAVCQHSCVIESARQEIGTREKTGNNDGEQVGKYLASTGLDQGYAWCAAFINWNYEKCGYEGPDKAAWSPSWFPDHATIFKRKVVEGVHPQGGDVFGIYFRSKGRIAHVGLIEKWKPDQVITIEGNTNKAGSREGDGVYRRRRLKRQVYKVSRFRKD